MEEKANCSVCGKSFERSTDPDKRYISCPAHSFGETVDAVHDDKNTYEGLDPHDL